MAYNPALYNPYGQFSWQQPQQSINGLTFIDSIDALDTLQMPAGSISQPYFLKDENKFIIVSFDNMGGSTKELFSFEKIQMPTNNNSKDFVTREYFDQQMNNILEAINGKHSIPEAATESAESNEHIEPNA